MAELALPGGHGEQMGNPGLSANRPMGHGVQDRALLPENEPGGHAPQALAAGRLLLVPGEQLVQERFETAPGMALNVPGLHRVGEEAGAGQ